MTAPADCHFCGRLVPFGGVPDDVGRPVHYVCRELRKQEIAHDASITARRVAKHGKPRAHSRPLMTEGAEPPCLPAA